MTEVDRLAPRRERHARLSAALGRMSDDRLRSILGERKPTRGWGASGTVELDGEKLFVKRIPLTDLEAAQPFSTANHYRIETFYNYGVGSAGFGVFRELAAHAKTTKWVLEGAAEGFPLMYHDRLLAAPGGWDALDEDWLAGYVRHWNGSKGVERYMRERSAAVHEAVIVLEHVPFTMNQWLADNLGRTEEVVDQVLRSISFLRANGIVHFDAHFANVVTDGTSDYLTDFGLALDSEFDLTPQERLFLDRHIDYDYGEALMSVGAQVGWLVQRLPDNERSSIRQAFGIEDATPWYQTASTLLVRIDDLAGMMPIDPVYLSAVRRYGPVMIFMDGFLETMRANPRKDTPFDEAALARLLDEACVSRDP